MTGKVRIIAAAAAGMAVIAAVAFFLMRGGEEQPPPASPTPVAVTEVAPTPTPTLREQLSARLKEVTLATSDAAVRELVAEITSQPEVLAWLANEDLIRRFTAAVDNVAAGRSPRSHLEFLRPAQKFTVVESGDGWTVDPASYHRYDTVTQAILAVDSAGVGILYRELRPLIAEAYREIAPPESDFDRRLAEAFDHLLACPLVEGPPALEPKVVTYTYVDPTLEALSPAQRHLLRFGPDNVRALKSKLEELRAAMLDG